MCMMAVSVLAGMTVPRHNCESYMRDLPAPDACSKWWVMNLMRINHNGKGGTVPNAPAVTQELRRTRRKHLSQDYLQDAYQREILRCIGSGSRYFVEFGFNEEGYGGSGSGPNTHALFVSGWRGLLLDGGHANASINLHRAFLYQSNIASLFAKHAVPIDIGYLSVDMDSHDLFVIRAILRSGYRPRLVTVEFNANYWGRPLAISQLDPTLETGDLPSGYQWASMTDSCVWGASAWAFYILLSQEHGYRLVALSIGHGTDMFFVRADQLAANIVLPSFADLFLHAGIHSSRVSGICEDPLQLRHPPGNGRIPYLWHRVAHPETMPPIIDYETYAKTGNVRHSLQRANRLLRRNMSDAPCFAAWARGT